MSILRHIHTLYLSIFALGLLLLLSACGTTATQLKQQPPIVISKGFQQVSPVPTVPTYRCGAWASNNAPSTYSVISIYSKLVTKDVNGVPGATASATVHFSSGDYTISQQPVSDSGGYVVFTLPLAGRQARLTPATVDVSFDVNGQTVQCTSAFFTPT